jgi:hypothetical protein
MPGRPYIRAAARGARPVVRWRGSLYCVSAVTSHVVRRRLLVATSGEGRRVLARGATDMIAKARDYRSRSAGLCRRHAGPGVECRCRKKGAVAGGVAGTRVRTDDPEVPAAATRLVLRGGARTSPRQIVGVDAASAIRATRGPGSDGFHNWRGRDRSRAAPPAPAAVGNDRSRSRRHCRSFTNAIVKVLTRASDDKHLSRVAVGRTPRSRSLVVRWDTVGLDGGHSCSACGWGSRVFRRACVLRLFARPRAGIHPAHSRGGRMCG